MARAEQTGGRRRWNDLAAAIAVIAGSLLVSHSAGAVTPLDHGRAAAVSVGLPTVVAAVDDPGAAEWSIAPADDGGPDGRVSLRHQVDPGGTGRDAVAVTNHGTEPVTFAVRAGDGVVGSSGAFDVGQGAAERAGAWLHVEGLLDGTLEVAAGETRVLPVTITVPLDAVPGYHTAGIVVAVSYADDGVTVTHRVGVRLHLEVAGEVTPSLVVREVDAGFTHSWLPFVPGTVRLEYTIANEGNVRLGASVRADATGPAGWASAHASDGVEEVLPGEVVVRTVEVAAWPLGVVGGEIVATPVAVGEDAVQAPGATGMRFGAAAVPWPELLLIGILAGLTVAIRSRARARTTRGRGGVLASRPISSPGLG